MEKILISKKYSYHKYKPQYINTFQEHVFKNIQQAITKNELKFVNINFCPICNENKSTIISEVDKYGFSVNTKICQTCTFIYLSPILDPPSMNVYYQKYYRDLLEGVPTQQGTERRFLKQLKRGKSIINYLESKGLLNKNQHIYDVGCGTGGIVFSFLENKYNIVGFDVDNPYLQYGIQKNLPLHNMDVFDYPHKCDVLILRHVLEHVANPVDFLDNISKKINNGQLLYIEVPGYRNLATGQYNYNFMMHINLHHVSIFDKNTLIYLLSKTGFEVLECDEYIRGIFKRSKKQTTSHSMLPKEAAIDFLKRMEKKRTRNLPFFYLRKMRKKFKRELKSIIRR